MTANDPSGHKDPDDEPEATPASSAGEANPEEEFAPVGEDEAIVNPDTGTVDADEPGADPVSVEDVASGDDLIDVASMSDAPDDEVDACGRLLALADDLSDDEDEIAKFRLEEAVEEAVEQLGADLAIDVEEWMDRAERAGAIEVSDANVITIVAPSTPASTIAESWDMSDRPRSDMTEEEVCESIAERKDWDDVRAAYESDEYTKKQARQIAARYLRGAHDWMVTNIGDDGDKPNLWWYDPDAGIWQQNGTHHAKKLINDGLGEHADNHERNELAEELRLSAPLVDEGELDAKTYADERVCVDNGVVNMRTLELEDHSPEYKFTWKVDVEYHKDAVPERILRFIRDVFARDADMWTFLQLVAEGLMPRRIDRAFGILYGPGKNGKSQLTKLFREHLLDRDLTSTVGLDQIVGDDEFASGGLQGSRLNIGSEAEHATVRSVTDLKEYTGGDGSQGNVKYKRREDFVNQAAMLFTANEPPAFEEKTDAIKDRLYPLPLPHKFTADPDDEHKDRTANIADKIVTEEELEGLLTLLMHAGQELIEDETFACPEDADERMDRYEAVADPYKRFKREHIVDVEVTQENELDPDDVVAVYRRMCDDQGERAMAAQTFKEKITTSTDIRVKRMQSEPFGDRHDTDANQPVVWRGLWFAESAVEYMPADVAERYGFGEYDIPDAEGEGSDGTTTSDEEEADSDLVELSEIEVGMKDVNVAAPIMGTSDAPDWGPAETEGRIDDGGSGVQFETHYCAPDLEAGETYVLRNVEVQQRNGMDTVVVTPGTDIEHIDVDGEQKPFDGDSDDPDGAGGGNSDEEENEDTTTVGVNDGAVLEAVERAAENTAPGTGTATRGAVAAYADDNLKPDDVMDALDRLIERGRVVEDAGTVGLADDDRTPEVSGDE